MLTVALYTFLLTAIVGVAAAGIMAGLFAVTGVRSIGVGDAAVFIAVIAVILGPTCFGPPVWLLFRYRDLTARFRQAALTDELTGLPNRRAFFERVEEALGPGRPFALLLIDVDRFKAINDRLGHQGGDAALVHVAREVRCALARADASWATFARLGGEEFAVFLDGAGLGLATRAADAICAGLRDAPFRSRGEAVPVTVSVGAWAGIASGPDADAALAAADLATYAAKARGRDRWEIADPFPPVEAAAA